MKKLSLLAQFSILSLVLFVAIGVALGIGLTHYFEQQEIERQKTAVVSLLQPSVAPFIDDQVLAQGATRDKYKKIENALSYLGGVGLASIKIWNTDGVIVYSDDPSLVGKQYPISPELAESLVDEKITGEVSDLTKDENSKERQAGYTELLEVYSPLRLPNNSKVRGAFEGYFAIDDLRALINETNDLLWAGIAGGFLFLYLCLFAIVRSASQRLIRQSRENTVLLADTQRKAARLEAVNELARSINQTSLDLDKVFQTALRGIERIAPNNGASLTLLDARTGTGLRRVLPSVPHDDDLPLAGIDFATERGLLNDKSTALLYVDTQRSQYEPAVTSLAQQGVRSFVAVPISLGERQLGILLVVSKRPNTFDEDMAMILKGVADQLAVAIENTRLIKETAETTALRETNRLKDEFVSMVSHELRTPLASIKGYSHTLMAADGNWDDTTRQEFLSIITDESDKLTDLVENLLEMSRIGAGRMPVTPEPILLSRFCEGVVQRVAKHYPGIKFTCELDDPLPVVEADPRRVEQVLINLLQNAAKYSGSDLIRIGGTYDGSGEVVLSVTDYGKGIAPEHLPHLFDKFYRVENGSTGKKAGTGLGLAICKALVEAQGGRIWVESDSGGSNPGQTTFFFTLPALVLKGEGGASRKEAAARTLER